MIKHYNKIELKDRRRQLRREMTYCEKIVWLHLRNKQLASQKFRRQYSIDNYVIDFYCPKLKLAVEIDGDIHELPCQKEYDKERQDCLENFGITFIRIKNEELLYNPNKTLKRIEDKIKELHKIKLMDNIKNYF